MVDYPKEYNITAISVLLLFTATLAQDLSCMVMKLPCHHLNATAKKARLLAAAEATAREVFEKGGVGADLPTLEITPEELGGGLSIVQLLVRAGLARSGKEAKRLIAENGARLDDAPLTDAGLVLDAHALSSPVKLSAGKKRHALVKLTG